MKENMPFLPLCQTVPFVIKCLCKNPKLVFLVGVMYDRVSFVEHKMLLLSLSDTRGRCLNLQQEDRNNYYLLNGIKVYMVFSQKLDSCFVF